MRRNRNGFMIILSLCAAVILAAMLGSGNVLADDVDVYRTSVKNGAMLVIDNSGSMSWPVYDGTHDYANFMRYMRDPDDDGDTSDAIATDLANAYPAGAANTPHPKIVRRTRNHQPVSMPCVDRKLKNVSRASSSKTKPARSNH